MEKIGVSDIYMGEVVRLVMFDMHKAGKLLTDSDFDDIEKPFCLKGSDFVTQILKAGETNAI